MERLRNGLHFNRPTHRCARCGSELRTAFTPMALWSIPVAVVTASLVAGALNWLQRSAAVTGGILAAAAGALVALGGSIALRVAVRGIELRRWNG